MDQDHTGTPNPIALESAPTTNKNINEPATESTPETTVEPVTPPAQILTPPVVPQPSPTQPKKPKGLIATIIILVILALAGLAFGIYGMFFKPTPECKTDCAATTDTPTPSPDTTTPTNDEEVEITDIYILRDLDEKIAILHDTAQVDATIDKGTVIGGYSNNIFDMYKTGYLDPSSIRIAYVINSLKSQFHYLGNEESEAVINNVQPEYREEVRNTSLQGINGNTVAKKYKDVFGEDIIHESSDDCYAYMYNSTYNFYYKNPIGGCGGTSYYKTAHRKTKYTMDKENAYVYVSVALLDGADNIAYCDISYLDISGVFELSDDAKACATLSGDTTFSLNESNYQDFATYRFIFNKADNGTYYFDKVEKV